MNQSLAEKIRSHLNAVYITRDVLVTRKDLEDLKEIGAASVGPFIEKNDPGNRNPKEFIKFSVEFECKICSIIGIVKIGNAALKRAISAGRHIHICQDCTAKQEERDAKLQEEWSRNSRVEYAQMTDHYIAVYLAPNRQWNDAVDWHERIRLLRNPLVNHEHISKHIRAMNYGDFLKTPYWRAISHKTKRDAGFRCQVCNVQGELHTHHRTYDNHGKEIFNMKDLVVLCSDCHNTFHEVSK